MKIFTLGLLLVSSLVSFSALAADHVVEVGTYKAIDAETGTIDTTLVIRADKTVNFKVKTPDFEMPEPGCEGTYAVAGEILKADMKCPFEGLEQIQVTIDITNATPDKLRSAEGVDVDVMIDALGSDAFKFHLRQIE